MRSKELWLVQENHATVRPDSGVHPRGMKTYSERKIELQNLQILKKMLEKSSQFLSSEQPCKRSLENCRSWKNILRKLVVAVNLEAIWFEFWMKGALVTGKSFVLCGWWFSNQFDIVSETHFSCDTVGHYLWLAILSSLQCPETDWNIRIEKQGYVSIWFDFEEVMFWCFILTSISVSTGKSWIYWIN